MSLRDELLGQGCIEKYSDNRNKEKRVLYFISAEGDVIAKVCLCCQELKLLDYFYNSKNGFGKKQSQCKDCVKLANSNYYKTNADEIKNKSEKYRLKNKELVWKYKKEWRERNRERHSYNQKRWREQNAEKFKDKTRLWLKRRDSLPTELDENDKKNILNEQKNICVITGSNDVHFGYFIPLSWGHGGTIYENCYYLDAKLICNKWASNPFEWIKRETSEYQHRFHSILVPMLAERNDMTVEEFKEYVYWCETNKRELFDV